MQRIIESEYQRRLIIRFIENEKLPISVSVTKGGRRTLKQNRLQRKWINEISDQTGDDPEDVRAYMKLTIGVPILREENEEFRRRYDEVVRSLDYVTKLAMMREPFDMAVTRLMNTKQQTRYLDQVYRHYTSKGIFLTIPDDGLLEWAEAEFTG